jgi:hypothetical protein
MKKKIRLHTTTAGKLISITGICWQRERVLSCFTGVKQQDPTVPITMFEFLCGTALHDKEATTNSGQVESYIKKTVANRPTVFSPDMDEADWTRILQQLGLHPWQPERIQEVLGALFEFEIIDPPKEK